MSKYKHFTLVLKIYIDSQYIKPIYRPINLIESIFRLLE